MKIWHNPRCRKSRETLALIEAKGGQAEVVLYLENTPSQAQLKNVLKLLGIKAETLVRKGEAIYKQNYKGKEISEKEWVKILVENPKLIERPIVIKGDQAVIGRPPENVLDLF